MFSYKYILLSTSNSFKGTLVVSRLFENEVFNRENILIVTNNGQGSLVELANSIGLSLIICKPKEIFNQLELINFDFLISCGWNYKISLEVIELSSVASLNCHSSFLPDYKGASSYKHAWANLEEYTGSTIHLLAEKFDQGDIVAQSKIKIFLRDTPSTLIYRIAEITSILLPLAIRKIENNEELASQKDLKGRYFYKTTNFKLIKYRILNLLIKFIGKKTIITKHKVQ